MRRAEVGPGSTVLVHAAAGGVGSAGVQLAKHLGARVVATASSDEKRQVALDLGADEAYGYDDFADRVQADVVLDAVGGDVFKRSIGVLNPLGTIVAIGFADGWWDPLDTALMVGRNLSLFGFYLGRLMKLRPDVVQEADARGGRAVGGGRGQAAGRRDLPARARRRRAPADRGAEERRQGRPCSLRPRSSRAARRGSGRRSSSGSRTRAREVQRARPRGRASTSPIASAWDVGRAAFSSPA